MNKFNIIFLTPIAIGIIIMLFKMYLQYRKRYRKEHLDSWRKFKNRWSLRPGKEICKRVYRY